MKPCPAVGKTIRRIGYLRLVHCVELRGGILPLRTGLLIKYPFPLCLCMVNGVRSAYQRRNTLGTTPEI
jgi:hypothetical protein